MGIRDATSGEVKTVLRGHDEIFGPCPCPLQFKSVSFSPSGNSVATCSDDGTAKIWDLGTGSCRLTISGTDAGDLFPHYSINSCNFSPDGEYVVTACSDGIARIW